MVSQRRCRFYKQFASEPQPAQDKAYFTKQKSRGSSLLTNWVRSPALSSPATSTRAQLTQHLQGFNTLLHAAATETSSRELQRLLHEGAPVNGEDDEGCTALHCAAAAGRLDNAHILLEAAALVDALCLDCSTPLHKAAGGPNTAEMVSLLIKHGADVNAKVRPADVAGDAVQPVLLVHTPRICRHSARPFPC